MRTRKRSVLAVSALVLIASAIWGMARLGFWLMVEDPVQEPAPAIVVLSGEFPFRAMEAASIYRQGWAREIWLTHDAIDDERRPFIEGLGLPFVSQEAYNRAVLARRGVPPGAIRPLAEPVHNTVDELRAVAAELRRTGGRSVIVVTSKPHSRRVKLTWRVLVGNAPRLILRFAADEPYEPRWWRNTRDALAVSREAFGIANVLAGFPVLPDKRSQSRHDAE